MGSRRLAAAVVALALACLGAGCSNESGDSEAVEAVRQYVKALAAGDFAAAMALRCEDQQIDSGDQAHFMSEVDRLQQSLGVPLEVAAISEADASVALTGGSLPDHEVRLTLRTDAGESQPMRLGTVAGDGGEQLCAFATEASYTVREEAGEQTIRPASQHVEDMRSIIEGAERESTGAVTYADGGIKSGMLEGTDETYVEYWSTFWRTGEFGGVTLALARYEDSDAASRAAADQIATRLPDATEMFSLTSMPTAFGLRHAASAWTFVQPSDRGDHLDFAVAVYDDVVFWIAVSPTHADEDHSRIEAVAELLAPDSSG